MQTRLLTFLAEIESALRNSKGTPREGATWESSRSVNYSEGMARLEVLEADSAGTQKPLGALLVQSFRLADGTPCLKATLSWQEVGSTLSRSIFGRPEISWQMEASRLAELWLPGPPANVAHMPALLAAG